MAVQQATDALPQRRCIVTGQTLDKAQLIRFVVGPEEVITPDISCKLPGRGLWVGCSQALLEKACSQKLFSSAAKRNVVLRDDLVSLTYSLLYERVLSALALARKSGEAVHGHEKVSSWLRAGNVIALLHATDASQDGVKKLSAPEGVEVYQLLQRDDLSRVMGTENAVHIAIANGPAGQDFLVQLRRFAGFVKETPL